MSEDHTKVNAEIVGMAFGDGSLIRRKNGYLRFQLRGDVTEERNYYERFVIPLFRKHITMPLINRNVSTVTSKAPYASFGISIESNTVGDYLHSLGIPIGRKQELIVPEWIFSSNVFIIGFLRGLFDTDGSIFCRKNYSTPKNKKHSLIMLKISTISKQLSKQVSEGLDILKIKHFVRRTSSKKQNHQDCYHVEVCGAINVKRWFSIIGSNSPKHVSKYQVWQQFGYCPPHTTYSERITFLKGELNPMEHYSAEVGEWSNPLP